MLLSLAVWGAQAHALGLGAIALQSGLSRPLQAKIPVYGLAADDTGTVCLKSRVLALDGSLLSRPVAELTGSGAGAMVSLRTVESINEPAVNISVEIGCNSAVKREYQLLLDPLPATLPLASSAPVEWAERPERKAASQAGAKAMPPTTGMAKTLASVVRKPPVPAKPRPAAESKSVLTLSAGNAEIEQVRTSVALRSATVLSEARVETQPARLAALRADQARIAALLRGEDPLAGTQAQLRDVQGKLLAAQKAASNAARQHEQEKTALMAAREGMVSGTLAALLGVLLLVCIAVIGWLLRRHSEDRRRQELEFSAVTTKQDLAPAAPLPQQYAEQETRAGSPTPAFAPAVPMPQTNPEAEPMDFSLPADEPAPTPALPLSPQAHAWHAESATATVFSGPPESLQLLQSWLHAENRLEDAGEQALQAAKLPLALSAPDDNAPAHAAEVAGMLLAAESWMAEHKPLRAAEMLRPYLERDEMRSPAPALYLLSLYRTVDDKGQIAAVLAQLQQTFPAQATAWSNINQTRRSMADFPAMHAVVDSLSDTDKLLPYLNSLLLAPEPFDFATYRDIVRAIRLASEMTPENAMQSMSLDFQ